MTTRPGRTTINLAPGDLETLRNLAEGFRLGRNLTALLRWLAETYTAAPTETAALLEAARDRANGGDEWNTLAILHEILPEFTLVAGSQTVTVDEIAAAVIVGLPNDE